MKIIKLLLLFIFPLAIWSGQPALAVEESASASVSADKIQQSLQERIKRAIEENLNRGEVTTGQPQVKAFIGTIDSLTEATLAVMVQGATQGRVSKQVIANDNTVVVGGKGAKIKFSELGLGENVIAMGITSDNLNLNALRIVVSPKNTSTITQEVVSGTISEFDPRTRTIILDTANAKLVGQEIIISRRAQLLDSELEPIALTDLEESQNIFAVVEVDTEEETNVIYKAMLFDGALPSPTQTISSCGDKVCQNVVCAGTGCPTPETPETCPADCTSQL